MRYRQKPVEIEAMLFEGNDASARDIEAWTSQSETPATYTLRSYRMADGSWLQDSEPSLSIATLEGLMKVCPGDYVIRGVQGEHYPCKPEIFAASYDLVRD